MTQNSFEKISWFSILSASFLIAGNLLGVGILALPIKAGLSGFLPSVLDILVICTVMLISAFIIVARLSKQKKNFDIPSFFNQELGVTGRWIAIISNLILLYGVLVAYLSAISSIVVNLIPIHVSHILITFVYFLFVTSLIMFGRKVLRKGNTILLTAVFICFLFLIKSGMADFSPHLLTYANWKYIPLGLPVAVSAFHFHNIIPTVCNYVHHNARAVRKVILIGVGIGLVMNLIWISVVLGSLLPMAGVNSILSTFEHGLPVTIPMTHLLHSSVFADAGLVFAFLAVTASYVANGTGLFGFIKDMTFTHFKTENKLLIGCLAFVLPLLVTIIYPQIFLSAIDIVGGIGETVLFAILPSIILLRINKGKSLILSFVGYAMFIIGLFIFLFISGQKFGLIHLVPTLH